MGESSQDSQSDRHDEYFAPLITFLGTQTWYNELGTFQRGVALFFIIQNNDNIPTCLLFSAAAAAKLLQSCPTLCDPIDSSPPGSPVPGILQARTLEWVAISFSNA